MRSFTLWTVVAVALAALAALVGCGGGSGGGGVAPPTTDDWTQGVSVETAASAPFRTEPLTSGWSTAFVGFYGAAIRRLAYQPDAGMLAFRKVSGNTSSMHLSRPNGNSPVKLASEGLATGGLSAPRFAPDGKQIVYAAYDSTGTWMGLVTLNGLSLTAYSLPGFDGYADPCFSLPQGDRLAFSGVKTTNQDLYWVRPGQPGSVSRVTNTTLFETGVDWSPDGGRLAYVVALEGGNKSLRTCDASNGANEITLIGSLKNIGRPRFSPDGRRILVAVTLSEGGNSRIGIVDRAGMVTAITGQGGTTSDVDPDWSPDGSRVVFSRAGSLMIADDDGYNSQKLQDSFGDQLDWWGPTSAPRRTLIGPDGSDFRRHDPPFGATRALAIIGTTEDGVAAALTAAVPVNPTAAVIKKIPEFTGSMAGAQLTASGIKSILIDRGAGLPAQAMEMAQVSQKYPGTVIVLMDQGTGLFTSVMPVVETAPAAAKGTRYRVTRTGNELTLSVAVSAVYTFGSDGSVRNIAPKGAGQVVLDATTAKVLRVL